MLPCLDLFSMDLLLVCVLIYCLNKWNCQLKLPSCNMAAKPGEDLATLTFRI